MCRATPGLLDCTNEHSISIAVWTLGEAPACTQAAYGLPYELIRDSVVPCLSKPRIVRLTH